MWLIQSANNSKEERKVTASVREKYDRIQSRLRSGAVAQSAVSAQYNPPGSISYIR